MNGYFVEVEQWSNADIYSIDLQETVILTVSFT